MDLIVEYSEPIKGEKNIQKQRKEHGKFMGYAQWKD